MTSRRFRPQTSLLLAAGVGVLAAWIFTILFVELYTTIPGQSLGRVNDFLLEAEGPFRALYGEHLRAFLTSSPAYIGSLAFRAPLAMAAMGLRADWENVYGLTALPCVAAAPILGAWLFHELAPQPRRPLWLWLSPLGLLLLINPIFIYSLVMGHPEDVLGASLTIAGVLQAGRGRAHWSMFLLGLAVANKSWALVGVPVALAALPRLNLKALGLLVAPPLLTYLPVIAFAHPTGTSMAASSGTIFFAPQLWWWFGPNFWVSQHAHELIVVVACGLGGVWRLTRDTQLAAGRDRRREALLLLALVLLLRAAMDPWDNVYYQLPFVMAVAALETGRLPRMTILATLLLTVSTAPLSGMTMDLQAVTYQLAVIPMIIGLSLRLFLPPASWDALVGIAVAKRRLRLAASRSVAGDGISLG